MNKYKILTDEQYTEGKLHRIQALIDFSDVKKGDIGGFVDSKDCLAQTGDCWIYNNAKVYDDGRVYDNAKVYDLAVVNNGAHLYKNAIICNDVVVTNNSDVYDKVQLCDNVIADNAIICGQYVIGGDRLFKDQNCTGGLIALTESMIDLTFPKNVNLSDSGLIMHLQGKINIIDTTEFGYYCVIEYKRNIFASFENAAKEFITNTLIPSIKNKYDMKRTEINYCTDINKIVIFFYA